MALLKSASSVADVLAHGMDTAPDLQDGSASESSKSGVSTSQASTISTSSHTAGVRPSMLRRRSKGKLKPVSSKRQLFRESQHRAEIARVKPKAEEINVDDMLTDIDRVDASDFEAALDKQASVFDGSTEIGELDYNNLDSLLADVGGADGMDEFDMEGIDEDDLGASLFDDPGLTDYLASTLPAPESPKPDPDPPTVAETPPIPQASGVPIPVPIPTAAASSSSSIPIPIPMAGASTIPIPIPAQSSSAIPIPIPTPVSVPVPIPVPTPQTHTDTSVNNDSSQQQPTSTVLTVIDSSEAGAAETTAVTPTMSEGKSPIPRKRKITKVDFEATAEEYRKKMEGLSKLTDQREIAFKLMADTGEFSISALVRYLGYFGTDHSRSDDCKDTSKIRRFFTFLEPNIRSMVGMTKFSEHIDAGSDLVTAYIRFLDTGDSRSNRDDGERMQVSVDIAHDSEADSRLLAEETEATAKASKVTGFAGLKSGSAVVRTETDTDLIKSAKKVKGFTGLQSTGKTIITVDKSEASELEAAAKVTDSAYEKALAEQRAKAEAEKKKRKATAIEVSHSALAAKSMFQTMDAEVSGSTPVPKSPKRRKRKKSAQE